MEEGVSRFGPIMFIISTLTGIFLGVWLFNWYIPFTKEGYVYYVPYVLTGVVLFTILTFILHNIENALQVSFLDRGIYNKEEVKLKKEIGKLIPQYDDRIGIKRADIYEQKQNHLTYDQFVFIRGHRTDAIYGVKTLYRHLAENYLDTLSTIELIANNNLEDLSDARYADVYKRLGELNGMLTNKELVELLQGAFYYPYGNKIKNVQKLEAAKLGLNISKGVNTNPVLAREVKPYMTLSEDLKALYKVKHA